jgi:hypothetical protein
MRLASLLGTALLLAAACSETTGPTDPAALLDQNIALWARQGVVSYQYTISRGCECVPESTGPTVVVVRNGTVEARRYLTGATVDPQFESLFTPVPGLFDLIRLAIEQPAAALAVRYNSDYGYPESIVIDWVAGTADDEVSYRITDFSPLPPG